MEAPDTIPDWISAGPAAEPATSLRFPLTAPLLPKEDDGRRIRTSAGLSWGLIFVIALSTLAVLTLHAPEAEAVGFRGVSSAGSAGATTLTLNKPTDVVQNDLLLASLTLKGGTTISVTGVPSGWTLLNRTDVALLVSQVTYYKIANASEGSSYTWTFGSNKASGGLIALSGVDTTSPFDNYASSSDAVGTDTTIGAPSITTATANTMLVAFWSLDRAANITGHASMAQHFGAESTGGGPGGRTQTAGATQVQSATGSTGSRDATSATADQDIGFLVAVKPARVGFNAATGSGSESATSVTVYVSLAAASSLATTVDYANAGTGTATGGGVDFTLTSGTLTFPAGNLTQSFTFTVVDDGVSESSETVVVNLSNPSNANLATSTHTYTITDNDVAGFTIVESSGSTAVSESGSNDTFTVRLDAQPASDVVLTLTSNDTGEATVSPATLTFGSGNFSTVQTVTVTGVDDSIVDGSQVAGITVSVDDGNSSNEYDPVSDQTVSVTVSDNDTAGFTLVESDGSTTVTEAGGTDTFTVRLNTQPTSSVTLTVTSASTLEVTVAPSSLVFSTSNYSTPQTVTVTGVDDLIADGNTATDVTVSVDDAASANEYDPVANQAVSVTNQDNDGAAINVVESGGSTSVSEAGTTDNFTVALNTAPLGNVVVLLSTNDTTETSLSHSSLTFTTLNWSTAQTVTVTGVDDALVDGSQLSLVTITVDDGNSSNEYDSASDKTVTVTIADNDAAGFTIVQSGGTTNVSESGSTDSFTVVLNAQPGSNVVLLLSSNDTGEAVVSPSSLTFGPGNYSATQTVTVTGVDDAVVDGLQVAGVTLAIDDANSSDEFDAVANQTVDVNVADNDTAGFTIAQSESSTAVAENGSTDSFTVVLTAQPAGTVRLLVSSNDTGEATASPSSLTFGAGNYSSPQTVTVTGVDDALVDGLQVAGITVSVDDGSSSDEFDAVADQTVDVNVSDNDTAGFPIVQSGGTTDVSENGSTDSFTVVLNAQPGSDVRILIVSNDTGEAAVSPANLTFGPGNYSTPQTITVTGVDDAIVDGLQVAGLTVSVDDANSSDEFDAVADQVVSVNVSDNDTAGLTIVQTGGTTNVSESGATDSFTVVLNAQPGTDVVLTLTSNDTGEATVSPASLRFGPGNYSSTQTVTVTGIDDAVADGLQVAGVTVSVDDANSSDEFDAVGDQVVSVNVSDNDTAGFLIVQSGGSTEVAENGTTDSFTVALTSQPASTVRLVLSSNDTSEATAAPASLTFGAGNYSSPQTVTITGVDDALADGLQVAGVTVSVEDGNSSNEFDAVADQTVSVNVSDNDTAGFSIVESSGSTAVAENGTADSFTVVLTALPAGTVVLLVSSNDTGEATASPSMITFGAGNYSVPQTVTVTGVDDALVDGSQAAGILVQVDAGNSSNEFDAVANQTVSVSVSDNDTAGFTVVETSGNTAVSETGSNDTFTVVLNAQPAGTVRLLVASNDTSEATASPSSLTFGPGNYTAAQTVTVTGVDDVTADGLQVAGITLQVDDANSSDEFDAVANQTVSVDVTDDDTPDLVIVESGGTTQVGENGSADSFTVALTIQPAGTVRVLISSSDTGEATASPTTLTFGAGNYSTPQNVTVTGVDDFLVDGSQVAGITVSVDDANSSDEFDDVANKTVSVTILDNDTAGFTIVQNSGSTGVSESGTGDTFTVALNAQPAGGVRLILASNDTGEATVSPASLTFGPGNFSAPQTVTVTGVDDALADGLQVVGISVSIDSGNTSDEFDGVGAQTVSVNISDNDTAGFSIVESGGSTAVAENGTTDSFTVVLNAQPAGTVRLLLASNDTGEATVSPSSLTFGPGNYSVAQTVTATGIDDASIDGTQVAGITVSIDTANTSDEFDGVGAQTVSVNVSDNDTAGFTVVESGGSTGVAENGTADTFTAVLNAQPAGDVRLFLTSNDTGEATVSPSSLTFGPGNYSVAQVVTVTGVEDALVDGEQPVGILVTVDSGNSSNEFDAVANQTVSVSVSDNDAAGFTVVETSGNTAVSEAGANDTFTVALTAQPSGDVRLLVSSNDTGEATAAPASLTFGPGNYSVAQTVTVTGVDDAHVDGLQVAGIAVSVDDGNSSNEFDAVADQTVSVNVSDNDTAGFTLVQTGGSTDVAENGTTDSFTVSLTAQPAGDVRLLVSSNDTGEASVSPSTLTFGAGNYSTPQTITVTGIDDALADGLQVAGITVSIDAGNSSNEFDAVSDQMVSVSVSDNDTAGFTFTQSGGSTAVGENGSTDSFTVVLNVQPAGTVRLLASSNDTGEATVSPSSLTFGPGNYSVAQTVTVTGVDDALVDGLQVAGVTVRVDDGNSSDEFDAVSDQTLAINVSDNDTAGFTITHSGGSTSVSETTNDTFSIALDAQPAGSVFLLVSSNDTGEATVSPATLMFGPGNYSVAQVVTVTGVDDVIVDGIQTISVTISVDDANSSDEFDAVSNVLVSVTVADDDSPGITIVETGGSSSVSESGSNDSLTVRLNAAPSSSVRVDITSDDSGEATVSPFSLTFGPGNYSTPQAVTLVPVDDALVDGTQTVHITISIDDANSADEYDSVENSTVNVTVTDDDAASFVVSQSGGSTDVSESGSADTFTVVLGAQPAGTVQVLLTSNDTGEATVSPSSLTFGPGNYSTAQNVTVTGIDDALADGLQVAGITVRIDDGNSSDEFDAVGDQTVSVNVSDNNTAGVTIVQSDGSTAVAENGTTDSLTVALAAQPASDVRVLITSNDTGEATVSPSSLTFGPGNYSTPQTVTITGIDDAVDDGTQVAGITISVDDGSSSNEFDDVGDQTISVNVGDDETAGFTIVQSGGSTNVSESGTNDTFTVVLSTEPSSTVVVAITSADTGEATVSPATLTFGPGNYSVAQTVTVTGVDDSLVDGSQSTNVTVSIVDGSSADEYDPLADQVVSVTTTDNDTAALVVVESAGSTVVNETGTTDTFTVRLGTQPASDVTLSLASADTGEAALSHSSLTFTAANWSTAQTVTVTGVNDPNSDGNQTTNITIAVDDALSSDEYDAVPNQTVTATTTDDDAAAGFSVVQSGGSTAVNETGTTDTFTVVLNVEPASNVTLTLVNGDASEISLNRTTLVFTSANWSVAQTVQVAGLDDMDVDGTVTANVTIRVDDGNSSDEYDAVSDQLLAATNGDNDNSTLRTFLAQMIGMVAGNASTLSMPAVNTSANFSMSAVIMNSTAGTNLTLSFNMTGLDALPNGTPSPPSATGLANMWNMTLEYPNGTDFPISTATVRFFVSTAWINANCAPPGCEVRLFHYTGTTWETLAATLVSSDTDGRIYESITTGFSPFAVGGVSVAVAAAAGGGGGGGGAAAPAPVVVPPIVPGPDEPAPFEPVVPPLPPIVPDVPPLLPEVFVPGGSENWQWVLIGASVMLVGAGAATAAVRYDVAGQTVRMGRRAARRARSSASRSAVALAAFVRRARRSFETEQTPFEILPQRLEIRLPERMPIERAVQVNQAFERLTHAHEVGIPEEALLHEAALHEVERLGELRKELEKGRAPPILPRTEVPVEAAVDEALRLNEIFVRLRATRRLGESTDPSIRDAAVREARELNRLLQALRAEKRTPGTLPEPEAMPELIVPYVFGRPDAVALPLEAAQRAAADEALRLNRLLADARKGRLLEDAVDPSSDQRLREEALRMAQLLGGIHAARPSAPIEPGAAPSVEVPSDLAQPAVVDEARRLSRLLATMRAARRGHPVESDEFSPERTLRTALELNRALYALRRAREGGLPVAPVPATPPQEAPILTSTAAALRADRSFAALRAARAHGDAEDPGAKEEALRAVQRLNELLIIERQARGALAPGGTPLPRDPPRKPRATQAEAQPESLDLVDLYTPASEVEIHHAGGLAAPEVAKATDAFWHDLEQGWSRFEVNIHGASAEKVDDLADPQLKKNAS